jgi:stage V sporulation protein B
LVYTAANALATFSAVFIGCIVYLVVLFLMGGINENDMERIPVVGNCGIKLLRRIGVFKA